MTERLEPFLELRREPHSVARAELSERLTERLDGAIAELADDLPQRGMALVATGGYGARSLCLHSDVDLMLVHHKSADPRRARDVFRPLWDAKLRVGHSVRTPRQARDLARSDLHTFSSLLTSRLIAGDPEPFEALQALIAKLVARTARTLLDGWWQEESERRRNEPYRLMAMNLKTGRGGLRTLQILNWQRIVHRIIGEESVAPIPPEEAARETILSLRNALHAVAGRAHDVYDFELRAPVARWLGESEAEVGRSLLVARHAAEHMLDDMFEGPSSQDPSGTALHLMTGDRDWDAGRRTAMVEVLADGPDRLDWWRLVRRGWVRRALPEWQHMVVLPHLVPFHAHAVADHTLRTVDELVGADGLAGLEGPDREILILGAALHDIGKGRAGRSHSATGAELAKGLALRIGLERLQALTLERLVRHHLLLPDLATRFDLSDPVVVEDAADAIGDERTLDLLRRLTIADTKATGSDTWSAWREALLDRAVGAVEAEFARRRADSGHLERIDALSRKSKRPREEIEEHLAGLPSAYVATARVADLSAQLGLASPPPDAGQVRVRVEGGGATANLHLCTVDRTGLVADVSGVLALHNLSVIDARFVTRADGVAFDSFEVVDSLGAPVVDEGRLHVLEADLHTLDDAVAGLEDALADKRRAYESTVRRGVTTEVSLEERSAGWTIRVRAPDRPGLLHDLARVLATHDVDITRARIDTSSGVATDVFYVSSVPEDTAALEEALLVAV